ncbi:MAG: NADPH-dependent oxidoreductase [Streptosporangiales bacterium]|nr:NADPH-dependent oxidoreductase [Streptosporangiales bacterium]
MNFTVVVGHPRPGSPLLTAARSAAAALAPAARRDRPEVVDLAEFGPELLWPQSVPQVDAAVRAVRRSSLLLVASPVLNGTYSGLLKVFADRLPLLALEGAVAIPMIMAADPVRAEAAAEDLRALLAELGATLPAPALTILDTELSGIGALAQAWALQVAEGVRAA